MNATRDEHAERLRALEHDLTRLLNLQARAEEVEPGREKLLLEDELFASAFDGLRRRLDAGETFPRALEREIRTAKERVRRAARRRS